MQNFGSELALSLPPPRRLNPLSYFEATMYVRSRVRPRGKTEQNNGCLLVLYPPTRLSMRC